MLWWLLLQVEHTVTEEITGIDIVQTQVKIAGGASLAELGLGSQELVPAPKGFAIQCRVTSEDPEQNFQVNFFLRPDFMLSTWRCVFQVMDILCMFYPTFRCVCFQQNSSTASARGRRPRDRRRQGSLWHKGFMVCSVRHSTHFGLLC